VPTLDMTGGLDEEGGAGKVLPEISGRAPANFIITLKGNLQKKKKKKKKEKRKKKNNTLLLRLGSISIHVAKKAKRKRNPTISNVTKETKEGKGEGGKIREIMGVSFSSVKREPKGKKPPA